MQELGVATLNALFVNANRDPNKSQPAKAQDFCYFKPDTETKVVVPSTAAEAFFSLVKESRMPEWVMSIAPLDQLRGAVKDGTGKVTRPRAWIGPDILLLKPRLEGSQIKAPVALVNGAVGVACLIDIDSGAAYTIELPDEPPRWTLEAEFTLLA